MSKPTVECSNCNQCFEAHYPYCPYCGQPAENKLTLGVLFNNTINNYFSVDARFFRSFIPLMIRPGYLAKKFVQGKRIYYLHPAQMYLFISVVFFFLFSFISREQVQNLDTVLKKEFDNHPVIEDSLKQKENDSIEAKQVDSIIQQEFIKPLKENHKELGITEAQLQQADSLMAAAPKKNHINTNFAGLSFKGEEIDSMLAAGASDEKVLKYMGVKEGDGILKRRLYKQVLKFYKNKSGGSILQAFYDSIPVAMFILLPIFALILKLFYFKKGRFAHHLVFSFYFFSYLFTVFAFLVAGTLIWENFPAWFITLVMFSTFFYLLIGVKRFYEQGYFLSFIKSSVVTFMFMMLVLPLAATIVGVMAFLFY